MAEWFKVMVLKTVVCKNTEGSNPSSSLINFSYYFIFVLNILNNIKIKIKIYFFYIITIVTFLGNIGILSTNLENIKIYY